MPATLFDVSAVDVDVDRLGSMPLRVLRGVSATKAREVAEVLGVETLHDLAHWPPYRAALEILADAVADETSEDDEVPDDLVPSSGTYPTERVVYERLLLDRELTPADRLAARGQDVAGGKTTIARKRGLQAAREVVNGRLDLVEAGPLPLRDDAAQQFVRTALGAVARFSQSWYREGLTLGQLLHSVALAPGEMTRVAMIDWSRRSRAEILGAELGDEAEAAAAIAELVAEDLDAG